MIDKNPINFRRARKVTKRFEQELVRDRIHNHLWKKDLLQFKISSKLTPFLERILMIEDTTRTNNI